MENYRKRKSERAESKKGNESPCFLRSEFSESTGSDFYMILPYWSPVDTILHIFFLKSQVFFQEVFQEGSMRIDDGVKNRNKKGDQASFKACLLQGKKLCF